MCGRLDLNQPAAAVVLRFPELDGWRPSRAWPNDRGYNTPPGVSIPVVIERSGERQVSERIWGPGVRIQGRWKQVINAKLDRLMESAMWKPAMMRGHRGVVAANGYYEWQRRAPGSKQPYYVCRTDGRPMALAALYGRAPIRADGEKEPTVVVVTRDPCGGLEAIHDRIPLELPDDWVAFWLDSVGEVDIAALERVDPTRNWQWWPVSTRANSPSNDDRSVIAPVANA
ncbi:SOS response-associated peptidase [Arhodomonas sp. AD133]|uniref:SOS response-associated peptidase n=1 Tax=Arhodomonas sp. AD133 TaxID=3415009 RepID=UPI003EB98EAD